MTKLLYHSILSSTPSGTNICWSCSSLVPFEWFLKCMHYMLGQCLIWLHIIFYLLWKHFFKAPNSCKYIAILIMHCLFFPLATLLASVSRSKIKQSTSILFMWLRCTLILKSLFILDLFWSVYSFTNFHICLLLIVWQFMLSSCNPLQSGIANNNVSLSGPIKTLD